MSNSKKKSKKNKKVDKRVLTALLVALAIVVIMFIVLLVVNVKSSPHDHPVMGIRYADEIAGEPNLTFTNIGELDAVTDNSTTSIELAKNFRRIFEDEIPTLYNQIDDLDESEFADYYEDNKTSITNNYYGLSKEDFLKLCKDLVAMQSRLDTDYKNCNFEHGKNEVKVTCEYKNGEKIVFYFSKGKQLSYSAE